jgi:hypothetical protein
MWPLGLDLPACWVGNAHAIRLISSAYKNGFEAKDWHNLPSTDWKDDVGIVRLTYLKLMYRFWGMRMLQRLRQSHQC